MEERYEIRGKIGQGGVGAVYRAHDKVLNREVAIKRLLPDEKLEPSSEAAAQLTKEAGALSALQHPHIVTIFDVGIDRDGSFVVMELLQGKTVDDVVEKAVFTWSDFREFAMQTQEALIAAQDLSLVHRDLKPSNIMLTWLPSGKFQVKIVDCGLAKFTPKPSLQTIDQKDSIFGSIFFMAPEQFERVELDARTDMYAIGCVYYYALTGMHPFDGETGPQVMVAHLDHRVYPLHEIRPDLPRWVCDWIMWHINRLPEHRPTKARDSLALFMQNDALGDKAVVEAPAPARSKPKLLTPGAPVAPVEERPAPPLTSLLKTAPRPITPPENFGRPSIHTSSQVAPMVDDSTPAPNAPEPAEVATPPVAEAPPEPVAAPVSETPVVETLVIEETPPAPKPKPRLVIPGATPTPSASPAASSPAAPAVAPAAANPGTSTKMPVTSPVSVAVPVTAAPASPPPPPVISTPVATKATTAAPSALTPRTPSSAGAKPALQVATTAVATARTIPTSQVAPGMPQTGPLKNKPTTATALGHAGAAATPTAPKAPGSPLAGLPQQQKKGMSSSAKVTISVTLGIISILVIALMVSNHAKGKINKRYNEIVSLAAMGNTRDVPINNKDLDILLAEVLSNTSKASRETIYKALYLAESTDGTNIDAKLVSFATTQKMNELIRADLLGRVIGGRINAGRRDESTAKALLAFVKSNPNPESAAAAIEAMKGMAKDEYFADIISVLQFSVDAKIRQRCEEVALTIIKQSSNSSSLGSQLESAYSSAMTPEVKQALLRVIAATGHPKGKEWVLENLKGSDKAMQIAAADAAKNWPDNSLIDSLLGVLDSIQDPMLHSRLFHSCREFLLAESERTNGENGARWQSLADVAREDSEQEAVISSLVMNSTTNTQPWAAAIIKKFEDTADSDRVVDRAAKAMDRINALLKKDTKEEE